MGSLFSRQNPFHSILTGLFLLYSLTLTGLTLNSVLVISGCLSCFGALVFFRNQKSFSPNSFFSLKLNRYLWITYFLGISIVLASFLTAIDGWDPRSVWFFHAKIIYFANALHQDSGWLEPLIQFSHPQYPKLVACLGAIIATLQGSWTEYGPKAAVGFIVAISFLGMIRLQMKQLSHSLFSIFLFLLFTLRNGLWNGYVDAPLALVLFVSHAYFFEFNRSKNKEDFLTCIQFLFLLPLLKDEGLILFISSLAVFSIYLFAKGMLRSIISDVSLLKLLPVFCFPIFYWSFLKHHWGLKDYFEMSPHFLQIAIDRAMNPKVIFFILKSEFILSGLFNAVLIAVGVFVYCHWKCKTFTSSNFSTSSSKKQKSIELISLSVAIFYLGFLVFAYLITPFDIYWHVETSATRTSLSISSLLLIYAFTLFESMKAYDPNA